MVAVVVVGRLSGTLAGRLLRLALLQLSLEGGLLLCGRVLRSHLGLSLEGLLECVVARRVYAADTHGGLLIRQGSSRASKRCAEALLAPGESSGDWQRVAHVSEFQTRMNECYSANARATPERVARRAKVLHARRGLSVSALARRGYTSRNKARHCYRLCR